MQFTTDQAVRLLQRNTQVAQANLAGVDATLASRRPAAGGNSIAWVLGHIAFWRQTMLDLVGGERLWSDSEGGAFRGQSRGAEPPAELPREYAALGEDLNESMERLRRRLAPQGADEVAPADWSSETAGTLLDLLWHETYHVGQLGILRRFVGLPGAI